MSAALALQQSINVASTYEQLEARIQKADAKEHQARWDGLLGRSHYGRKLLEERGDRGRLPNGRVEQIRRDCNTHVTVSAEAYRMELSRRMRLAEQYPTEADLRAAFKEYGSWSAICARGLGERGTAAPWHTAEVVSIDDLRLHPHDPQQFCAAVCSEVEQRYAPPHPSDYVAHIVRSIEEHGLFQHVVTARDGTILAGHGVVEAARRLGIAHVPTVRLNVNPDEPKALKLLVGHNKIANLADVDLRAEVELLREIQEKTGDLLGTGYNAEQLQALVFKTRLGSEVKEGDAVAEWTAAGMPAYERQHDPIRLIVTFETHAHRERYVKEHDDLSVMKRSERYWSARWPKQEVMHASLLKWQSEDR